MLHKRRVWTIREVSNPAELVDKLKDMTWCGCQGFRLGGYLWLNDSTGPDGAQEYGVVRASDGAQVESITVSWCEREDLARYIEQASAGAYDAHAYATVPLDQIDTAPGHVCPMCR